MAKKNKLSLNKKGFEAIRKTPAVRENLRRRGNAIAKAASKMGKGGVSGYKVTELVLEDPRGAVSVMATGHAHRHNRKHNALIRALDAGRD